MSESHHKKILLVTRPIAPPWDEASKNFAFNLAKNITDQEIYLLTNGLTEDFPEHIHQKPIYTSNEFSYIQKLRLIKHLRKMRNDFDILHYIFTPTKQNAFLIKNLLSCKMNKCARTIQSIATLREDLYSDKDLGGLIFGDLVVTYSDYAKNKLNLLGFNNVKRVYPGIDLEYFKPGPKNEKFAINLKLNTTEFIVTYPGEYTRLGATDDIIEMLLQYSDLFKQNSIKLIFACRLKNNGDIKKKEEVIKKLKEHNCLDQVIFIDTFCDMAALYNLSDIIIFPIRDMKGKFDIPLVLIEAMASEKPVIISDLPIFQEFATADNSVKIESGNIGQLKDAIINLCQNKPLAEKIGKSSRKFVQDYFDIKKVAQIYREIYAKL